MGRVIISGGSRATVPYVGPKASLTPTSGVTYTDGLSGLEPSEISSFAQAISNVTGVTNDTTAMYIDYGDVHRKISVGDQVTIAVNNVHYAFDVIGFNHDDLTDSMAYGKVTATGKAGMTLQMHDCFSDYAGLSKMNATDTNIGGWKECFMRNTTLAGHFEKIVSTWKDNIKTVNKFTSIGNKSTTVEAIADNLFLLAEIEIFGALTFTASGEGTQYAYYKAGGSVFKSASYQAANLWWGRSPSIVSTGTFTAVNGSSSTPDAQGSATSVWGVSFAFCI